MCITVFYRGNDFCIVKNSGSRKWNKNKLKTTEQGKEIERILSEQYLLDKGWKFDLKKEVSSYAISRLIKGICNDAQVVAVVANLCSVFESLRNRWKSAG